MTVFDFIDPYYFIGALCVGLLYAFLTAPKPEVIFKYPTPDNAGQVTYVDEAGVCYKYRVEDVPCPENSKEIREVPIQQK